MSDGWLFWKGMTVKQRVLGSPSGVFAGLAKRRIYWARQAAYLLGSRQAAYLLSSRQAASLLGSPSGMCWLQAVFVQKKQARPAWG